MLIDADSAVATITSKLISRFDMLGFEKTLIGHYREFLRLLFSDYFLYTKDIERQMRALGKSKKMRLCLSVSIIDRKIPIRYISKTDLFIKCYLDSMHSMEGCHLMLE